MKEYTVKGISIRHNGEIYKEGDPIELEAKDAERLSDLLEERSEVSRDTPPETKTDKPPAEETTTETKTEEASEEETTKSKRIRKTGDSK